MRILVVGAGGIGGYFGGRLADAGAEVVFVVRGTQKEAFERRGLSVRSPLGDLHIGAPVLHEDAARTGHCDVVLLCSKMWGLTDSLDALKPLLAPDAAVIPLQNGVEAEDAVAKVLGRERRCHQGK